MMSMEECRRLLPLPELMRKLGDGESAKKSARSPLREDDKPSFSVFEKDGRWYWKDHATGDGGDEVNYLEHKFGLMTKAAMQRYCELCGDFSPAGGRGRGARPASNKARKKVAPAAQSKEPAPQETNASANVEKKIVTLYDYRDAGGKLLHQTVRYEPKDFRQRRPSHEGELVGKTKARRDDAGVWWMWTLQDIEPVLYRLPELLAADPALPVFLVEGEKDADTLAGLGLVTTTVPMGAGKWRDSYTDALRDRRVIVLCDNDESGRKHGETVCLHLHEVANVGMLSMKDVWPDCPEKGDVTDWVAAQSADGEHEATWKEIILSWAPRAKLPPHIRYQPAVGYTPSTGNAKLLQVILAQLLAAEHRLKFSSERFWEYDHGTWCETAQLVANQYIHDAMLGVPDLADLTTDANVRSVLALMKTEAARGITQDTFDTHDRNLVNVQNGMLNVQSGELLPHAPEYYSTAQLPVDYVPAATCPLWLEWLEQTQPQEDIRNQIQEIFGYVAVPGNDYQKFFVLFGEGGSGKSTVLETLRMMIGRGNVTPLPLNDLDKGFTRAAMVGRLLYDAGELNFNSFEHLDIIKTISAGEEILVEEKYKTPYGFKPLGKIVGTSNIFLKTPDGSLGLWRRFVQIPFTRPVAMDKMQVNFYKRFQPELPGIFAWAMEGYRRLRARGFFDSTEAGKKLNATMGLHVNSVKSFLTECFVDSGTLEGGQTGPGFYDAYVDWCEFQAVKQYFTEANSLMREVFKHHPDWKDRQKFTRDRDGNKSRVVRGVQERGLWRDAYMA